jgi:integrase
MPVVDNEKTEDLTPEQLRRLLEEINKDDHPIAGPMMLLALYTGMRRGEMFRLQWHDVDFERGFINIRNPKGGIDQKIPLNDAARGLLENYPRTGSQFVFPGKAGGQIKTVRKPTNRIKERAGIPKDFRALHGLRHVFASSLASSGQVDMYVLQKLMTHKDPKMTARYSHLRDNALKRASNLAGDIINQAASAKDKNVVQLNDKNIT